MAGVRGGIAADREMGVCIQVESKVGVAVRAPGPHEEGTGSTEFTGWLPRVPPEGCKASCPIVSGKGLLRWASWKDLWGSTMEKELRGLRPVFREGCVPLQVSSWSPNDSGGLGLQRRHVRPRERAAVSGLQRGTSSMGPSGHLAV